MKLSILAVVGGFATYAVAAPAHTPYVVHEKRSTQTEKWSRRRDIKLNRDAVIPMSFGLTQRNLENGYDFLMDVSHPESENYGKHWTMEKVLQPLKTQNWQLISLDCGYIRSIHRDPHHSQVMAYRERYRG
jgi:Pro-kumamolisin, activation domain